MPISRLIVLTLALLLSAAATDSAQAMYDPGTGRFLQRDSGRAAAPGRPLIPRAGDGYQDGMNLTAGHFAMHGALDPTGLATISEVTTVAGMPYVDMTLQKKNGNDVYGATIVCVRMIADCDCIHTTSTGLDYYALRNVTLEIMIVNAINVAHVNRGGVDVQGNPITLPETYGHEQRHVQILKRAFEDPSVANDLQRVIDAEEASNTKRTLAHCERRRCNLSAGVRRQIGSIVRNFETHSAQDRGREEFNEALQPDGNNDDANNNGIDDHWETPGGQPLSRPIDEQNYNPLGGVPIPNQPANAPPANTSPLPALQQGKDGCWQCWVPRALKGYDTVTPGLTIWP